MSDNKSTPNDSALKDLTSGEMIEVISPSSFELKTVLIDSAYYNFRGREYRFLLSQVREKGLKIK